MIFRLHDTSAVSLRSYSPDGAVAGDVVMFFRTGSKVLGHSAAGFFILKDDYSTSGKTDDGVLVLASTVLTDMYWERVRKQALLAYRSGVQTITNGSTYTLTHPSDVTYSRHYSVKLVVPTTFTPTFDGSSFPGNVYCVPIGGDVKRWPLDLSDAENDNVTLAKTYSLTKVQTLDFRTDAGLPPTCEFRELHHVVGVGPGRFAIETTSFNVVVEYEYTTSWGYSRDYSGLQYAFNYFGDNHWFWATSSPLSYGLSDGEVTYEINPDGTSTTLSPVCPTDDTEDPDYFMIYAQGCGFVGDKLLIPHAYFDSGQEWRYGQYAPNVRELYLHSRQGGGWDAGVSVVTLSGSPRASNIPWTYAADSLFVVEYSYLYYYYNSRLIHEDATHEEFLDITFGSYYWRLPVLGQGVNGNVAVFSNTGAGVYEHTLVKFTKSGDKAVFDSYNTVSGILTDGINKYPLSPDAPENSPNASLILGEWFLTENNEITKIDKTNLTLFKYGHADDLTWSPTVPGGLFTYTPLALNDTDLALYNPDTDMVEIYEWAETDEYESQVFSCPLITEATAITSITVSATEVSLTSVRVLVSNTQDGTQHIWSGSAWVSHTDPTTGNTIAEFNAATHSLLVSQVGADIFVHIAMISTDGTATPTFHSVSAEYSRGADFEMDTAHLDPTSGVSITAVSATQTEFTNNTGATIYADCAIHMMV